MSTAPSAALLKKSVKKPPPGKIKDVMKGAVKSKDKAKEAPRERDLLAELGQEIEGITKEKALAAIGPLLESVDSSYIRIGGLLTAIRDGEFWKGDYESFSDMVVKFVGIRYRKAMYLIEIYEALIQSGAPWSKVAHLGWSKLKEIARMIKDGDLDKWVKIAEDNSVNQLKEIVKAALAAKAAPNSDDGKAAEAIKSTITTITFKLHEDQKITVLDTIEKAKKDAGTEYASVALEAVCLNYLAGGKVVKPKSLKAVLKQYKPKDVLLTFSEIWPDVDIEVGALPE